MLVGQIADADLCSQKFVIILFFFYIISTFYYAHIKHLMQGFFFSIAPKALFPLQLK